MTWVVRRFFLLINLRKQNVIDVRKIFLEVSRGWMDYSLKEYGSQNYNFIPNCIELLGILAEFHEAKNSVENVFIIVLHNPSAKKIFGDISIDIFFE